MLTLLLKGHVSTCPAIDLGLHFCTQHCEARRYAFTGILASITGLIEGFIGARASLGLVVDGIHGFFDGGGDFIGAGIAYKTQKKNGDSAQLRARGNKVIALLLFASAQWFAYEAIMRYLSGYSAYPNIMILIAGIALCVGVIRFAIIHKSPFKNVTRTGVLLHAFGDIVVSGSVVLGGICAKIFTTIEPTAFDLTVSSLSWFYVGLYLPYTLWKGKTSHHQSPH